MNLSIANRNPLNIRAKEIVWQGQTGVNKGFAVFETDMMGYRAALYLLMKYRRTYKLKTVRQVITRWAPPSENDTATYIKAVSGAYADKPNCEIFLESKRDYLILIKRMTKVERGEYADDQTLASAASLFQNENSLYAKTWRGLE